MHAAPKPKHYKPCIYRILILNPVSSIFKTGHEKMRTAMGEWIWGLDESGGQYILG